jgi:hypothetical protein
VVFGLDAVALCSGLDDRVVAGSFVPDRAVVVFDKDYPMGNRCKVRLVPWYSLATDQAHEIWWLNQAGFNELPNNSWPGGHVCGVSHDVGKAIQGKHIDLYVGVRARPGSGCADAYDPATFYVPVAVRTPQIDYLSGGCE